MEPTRLGLLVLGAVAVTSTTMLVTTRREGAEVDRASPLTAAREGVVTEPGDLAALVASIERLIDVMERGVASRGDGAPPLAPRQPVASSEEASLEALLREQNARLADLHAVLLAGARKDVVPDRSAVELRSAIDAGPRPTNLEAWEVYFTRYPPASFNDVSVELAVLGVADLLERFGWPQETTPPSSSTGMWKLEYRDMAVRTSDGVVTEVELYCSRDATYHIRTAWR